ncbi:MAG TPA: Ig-like domain-containing protein [Candidatus Nanoarchaeia archaeon]|nr:Ig-like domain-containing protein [Candidatus Nanoarchaeia archaeon]
MKNFTIPILLAFLVITMPMSIALTLTVDPLPSLTNQRQLWVSGATEPDALVEVSVNSQQQGIILPSGEIVQRMQAREGMFNGSIPLIHGANEIALTAATSSETAAAAQSVVADLRAPQIQITIPDALNAGHRQFTQEAAIDEPATITVIIDGTEYPTFAAEAGNFPFTLPPSGQLAEGNHTISVTAVDAAGNQQVIRKDVFADFTPPSVEITSIAERSLDILKPIAEQVGVSGTPTAAGQDVLTVHFQLVEVRGKTEPGIPVRITNLGNTTRHFFNVSTREHIDPVRGLQYQAGFRGDPLDLFVDFDDTVTSDANGEFSASLVLLPSRNYITFLATDQAGNTNAKKLGSQFEVGTTRIIVFDGGSNIFRLSSFSTAPNWIPAGELLQGNIPVGVFFRVKPAIFSLEGIKIHRITAVPTGASYFNNNLIRTRGQPTFFVDKSTQEIVAYANFDISRWNRQIDEIPDPIVFELAISVDYTYNNERMPTETLYLKQSFDVENPFETARFLTPERVERWVSDINGMIRRLDSFIDLSRRLAFFSLAGCTALLAYNYWSALTGKAIDQQYREYLYLACDRVGCPFTPPQCGADQVQIAENRAEIEDSTYVFYGPRENTAGHSPPCDCDPNSAFPNCVKVISSRDVRFGPGVRSSTEWICVEKDFTRESYYQALQTDVRETYGCYNAGPERYDDTKCLTNYLTKSGKFTNIQPYDDIYTSTVCGCFTGTYNHLQNIQKVLRSVQQCLEEAQEGKTSVGYCEKLLALYGCDLTFFALQKLLKEKERLGGESQRGNPKDEFGKLNEELGRRYQGLFGSAATGVGSQQLVHKACQGLITQDWSTLSGALDTVIESQPVAPFIGPLIADSRVFTYNPTTGYLTIKYTVTPMIISGGQTVHYDITLSCDRNRREEFCTKAAQYPVRLAGAVPPDGQLTQNIEVIDPRAAFWYNKATLTSSYLIGSRWENHTVSFPIIRKGGMIAECHASVGALNQDIDCGTYALGSLGSVEIQQAAFTPFRGSGISNELPSTYFPRNNIGVKLQIRPFGSYNSPTLLRYDIIGRDISESGSKMITPEQLQSGIANFALLDITSTAATADCSVVGQDMTVPFYEAVVDKNMLTIPQLTVASRFSLQTDQGSISYAIISVSDRPTSCTPQQNVASCTKSPGSAVDSMVLKVEGTSTSPTLNIITDPDTTDGKITLDANFIRRNEQNPLGDKCESFRVNSNSVIKDILFTYSDPESSSGECRAGRKEVECEKSKEKPIKRLEIRMESPINTAVEVSCVNPGPNAPITLYTQNICSGQRGFPPGNYRLRLALYQDVDSNSQYSEGDQPLLFNGAEQVKELGFDIQSSTDGHIAPVLEIVQPQEQLRACDYASDDIIVSAWDDANILKFEKDGVQVIPTENRELGTYTIKDAFKDKSRPVTITVKDNLANEGKDTVALEQC